MILRLVVPPKTSEKYLIHFLFKDEPNKIDVSANYMYVRRERQRETVKV